MFVYFDLDDTLLDHTHAERQALADLRDRYLEIFGTLSVDELQTRYREESVPLWRQYAEGGIGKDTLKQQRFEQLLASVGAPHADPALVGRYYLQRYGHHWRFVEGARAAYETIAHRQPVGILTNGFVEVQTEKVKEFPVLEERAETVVMCEEIGALKPDPDAFAYASEQAGVDPEEVLYVGDSYQSDVEGARQAGWQVAWFVPDGPTDHSLDGRGFTFQNWKELVERLK